MIGCLSHKSCLIIAMNLYAKFLVASAASPFIWGSSSAAYQIEGAVLKDGRKPCIWDVFCEIPGKILNGDTADNADLSYDRFETDIGLLKNMGLKASRFGIAWPRIIPDGSGEVNPLGISHYNMVIDKLVDAGFIAHCIV